MEKSVYIIDLDKTLIRVNSFNRFTVWLARTLIRRCKYADFLKVILYVAERKLRLCSHRCAKWKIMRVADRHLLPVDYLEFAVSLGRFVRGFYNSIPEDSVRILATAAPEQYASQIARYLDFSYCVATPMSGSEETYTETRGENKLAAVREIFERHRHLKVRQMYFYTDHIEDTPLAEFVCEKGGISIFVNPDE